MENNGEDFCVSAILSLSPYHKNRNIGYFNQDVDTSNRVTSGKIYYWVGKENLIIPSNPGFVALVSCKNITVSNVSLKGNGQGVLLVNTTDSIISDTNFQGAWLVYSERNTLSDNTVNSGGINLDFSSNNVISNNTISSAGGDGVSVTTNSSNNSITNNIIYLNRYYGIDISSNDNLVSGNTIYSNSMCGILLRKAYRNIIKENRISKHRSDGIHLTDSKFNEILSNEIFDNNKGIYLGLDSPWGSYWGGLNENNIFTGNNVSDNKYGLISENSSSIINSNRVCDNTILDFDMDSMNNEGKNNFCDNFDGWNDEGTIGCTYSCSVKTNTTKTTQ